MNFSLNTLRLFALLLYNVCISNIFTNLHRRIDEFGFSGSERRRQPERLQTCYENHNAVRIKGAYFEARLINRISGIFSEWDKFTSAKAKVLALVKWIDTPKDRQNGLIISNVKAPYISALNSYGVVILITCLQSLRLTPPLRVAETKFIIYSLKLVKLLFVSSLD